MPSPLIPDAADLASGDSRSAALSLSSFVIDRIRSMIDPFFDAAYAALWAEFGQKHQMERRELLAARFAAAPGLCYELVLLRDHSAIAAVRDHTAILVDDEVIVHLSHLLVTPNYRGSGVAGWMRAFPVALAREIAPDLRTTLVAELEPADRMDDLSIRRLRSYERAGFRKIDPRMVRYFQPDFRAPEVIAADGGSQPVPFELCLREVGRPPFENISGARIRRIVAAVYRMYGVGMPGETMAHPALDLTNYPPDTAAVRMFPPTAALG